MAVVIQPLLLLHLTLLHLLESMPKLLFLFTRLFFLAAGRICQAEGLFALSLRLFGLELLGSVLVCYFEPHLKGAEESLTARQLEDLLRNVVPALINLHIVEYASLSCILLVLDVEENILSLLGHLLCVIKSRVCAFHNLYWVLPLLAEVRANVPLH